MTTQPLCDQCSASGLPILPVRYCVTPRSVRPGLPSWASGARVKNVELDADFHYALRTLREGYIYLYYEKNLRGAKQWECYAVGQDGGLRLQPDAKMAQPQVAPTFACSRTGHSSLNVHFIVIERPEKCGATWIAFSPLKWSDDTLEEYTLNTKVRNARMQTIHPAQMAAGAKHSHGALADRVTIEQVIEYAPGFEEEILPHGGMIRPFTKEDGSFDAAALDRMSTLYPWHLRPGQAEPLAARMKARAKVNADKENKPHVLALWDATGIAHELNGFRNDAAGWIAQYGVERELQIAAVNTIEGTQRALERRANDDASDAIDNPWRWGANDSAERLKNVAGFTSQRVANERQMTSLWEQDALNRVPRTIAQQRMAYVDGTSAEFAAGMKTVDASIARLAANRAADPDYARRRSEYISGAVAHAWPRYRERLDVGAMQGFKSNWQRFLAKADRLVDARTVSLVAWLEADLFVDTLEDFHRRCIADAALFEDVVGQAIFGMGSCKSGQQKIDSWVKEAKASVRSNLLWRAVALNQEEGIVEVDAALQHTYGPSMRLTSQAFDNASAQVKWNKLADLTKKSLTLFNTQMKAVNDAGSGIKALGNTHGLEMIFVTVGGSWLKPLTATVDTVNEAVLRMLLLVRSGADPLAAKALGAWDAMHGSQDREMLVRRLANQDFYLSVAAKAQYEEQAAKWAKLRVDIEVPDAKRQSFNAARDARMALIVAVFEAFNLYKAGAKAKKEPGTEKLQAQLTAAKLATAAAAIDVTSNWVKGLAGLGDKAVSYQLLKLGGGTLSAVASGYGAALDFGDAGKTWDADDYRLAVMYSIRGWFQAVSGLLTAMTALSYCSPLIETFGARFGQRLAGRAVSWVAARLLLGRAALMLASIEVSIFVLFVTVVIWYFEDDSLQKWCDRSAFGASRKKRNDAYARADAQMKAFEEALKDVQ